MAGVAYFSIAFIRQQCRGHRAVRLARGRGLERSLPRPRSRRRHFCRRALGACAQRGGAALRAISKAWLTSRWCKNELTLARPLNKRLFGVLIEEGLAGVGREAPRFRRALNYVTRRNRRLSHALFHNQYSVQREYGDLPTVV